MKITNHAADLMVLMESFTKGEFGSSWRFEGLEKIIQAHAPEEVTDALKAVEAEVASGKHAAGFVSYEAASALNPELAVMDLPDFPLVWFGIFRERRPVDIAGAEERKGGCDISPPRMEIGQRDYQAAIEQIREAIAAGDTYQVNFTTGQLFDADGELFALYRRMCRSQQAPFSAWINIGTHRILSASPELFFSLKDGLLTMRPMKGTAPRMPLYADDLAQREKLARSEKERAENLMIVDLVRNDLSIIAETGSVTVPRLFDIETYPTVHQMTSTICARIKPGTGLTGIFRALFPCGSVTGAPKRKTMEIIRKLEQSPRGIYCGAIGYLSPGGEALFSVAIRTAVIEAVTGKGRIGIGSGITWDSSPVDEFQECKDKSAFLYRDIPPFQLIESIRHDQDGYLLLERHLKRLAESAAYFGFGQPDEQELRNCLAGLEDGLEGPHKVRLLLADDGTFTIEAALLETAPSDEPLAVMISQRHVDSKDPFLYHKTTHRSFYEQEIKAYPGFSDILFLNERGEVTEGTYNNIVLSIDGERLTPEVRCGLLPGVMRQELIEKREIREAVIRPEDLSRAEKLWLINSVRGWRECRIENY